ncbi:MAG: hypothetical protein ONB44_00140 [candidate division KSB1 bacterium]|nr:hypothetical protein [candidate division KSB1 bacterium]MDZ7300531.1 hypothetical protein [candidate division KSB1 bacterium]MDZ7309670.1 hypothetical protein [candidate division KSB1 bacterium]
MHSGCSDRPRLNPLDPKNPNTLGKPTGLRVVSMRDTVELRWNRLEVNNLTGFRIYRQKEGESNFAPIAQTSARSFTFRDLGVSFGIVHSYCISALAEEFESSLSDVVSITPGPTFSWVADDQFGALIKLSHDGMHEILRTEIFYSPSRLQIDAKRRCVWVLAGYERTLGRFEMNGLLTTRVKLTAQPVDLAVDPQDGSVWVADTSTTGLMKFDNTGALIDRFESYKKIAALAVHPETSELWVLDRSSFRILILSSTGELRRITKITLQRPSDIDIDERTGKVWIADGTRVMRLDAQGELETFSTLPFRFAYRLAADRTSGACWCIDYSSKIRDSRIIKLAATGEINLPAFEGFDIPQSLAVNPYDGSCLVADTGNHRLVRISSDGRILGFYDQIYSPVDIDTAL